MRKHTNIRKVNRLHNTGGCPKWELVSEYKTTYRTEPGSQINYELTGYEQGHYVLTFNDRGYVTDIAKQG